MILLSFRNLLGNPVRWDGENWSKDFPGQFYTSQAEWVYCCWSMDTFSFKEAACNVSPTRMTHFPSRKPLAMFHPLKWHIFLQGSRLQCFTHSTDTFYFKEATCNILPTQLTHFTSRKPLAIFHPLNWHILLQGSSSQYFTHSTDTFYFKEAACNISPTQLTHFTSRRTLTIFYPLNWHILL